MVKLNLESGNTIIINSNTRLRVVISNSELWLSAYSIHAGDKLQTKIDCLDKVISSIRLTNSEIESIPAAYITSK